MSPIHIAAQAFVLTLFPQLVRGRPRQAPPPRRQLRSRGRDPYTPADHRAEVPVSLRVRVQGLGFRVQEEEGSPAQRGRITSVIMRVASIPLTPHERFDSPS